MNFLTKQERVDLRGWFDDPRSNVFYRLLEQLEQWLKDQSVIKESEFDTLKATFQREFQVMCIKELQRIIQEQMSLTKVDD